MKQITLKLTAEEARTVYRALIHASMSAEKEIETAAEFPGSDVLQEAGKKAEERKAKIDELAPENAAEYPHRRVERENRDGGLTGGRNHGNERNHLSGI